MCAGVSKVAIYVIDADASVRDALCRLVMAAGVHAYGFESVAQLAKQPALLPQACVLLDCTELVQPAARAWAASHAGVPVIVLCGEFDEQAGQRARSFGARFLLNKPVDAQALFDAIAWVTAEND